MARGDLERSLRLEPVTEGVWAGVADVNYQSANGMFGGWTAALGLAAVQRAADGAGTPASLTMNFVKVVEPGTDVVVHTRRMGGSRSVSQWQCEVAPADGRDPLAFGSVVLAERRDSDGRVEVAMPEAPDPAGIEVVTAAPGTAGERTTVRPVAGFPPLAHERSDSLAWVDETSGRPVDHVQLAYLADHRPPRSFYWGDGPRPSATLTLSVWFHATDEELAAVGDDVLLSEAFAVRGARSTSEEHLRLWSRHGALLASSAQMAWFR